MNDSSTGSPANTGRQIVLAARPKGKPTLSDFRLEEVAIPTPGPGQFLVRVQYLSLDPYMRGRMEDRKSYAAPTKLDAVMPGESVATVVASNHSNYSAGDMVLAPTGWRTHPIFDRGPRIRQLPARLASTRCAYRAGSRKSRSSKTPSAG